MSMNESLDHNLAADYRYTDSAPTWSNTYLWPVINRILANRQFYEKRAFEIGCGNGSTANMLSGLGFEVTGIDPSKSGIVVGQQAFPHLKLYEDNAYEDLAGRYGRFSLVISLEVIEHCFYPRQFARTFFDLIDEGGG